MKKIFLFLLPIFCNFSFAYNNSDFPNSYLQEPLSDQKYYVDKYKINIDNITAKKIINRYRRYKSILNDTYNMQLLLKPLVKPIMNIDTIYVHPNFISTILFPKSFKIISAKSSIPLTLFSYSENLIELKPKKGIDIGNIVVTAFDAQTKKNKVFNFIVRTYSLKNLVADQEYGMYATPDGTFFSFTTKYVQLVKIQPIKLLSKYVEVNGLKTFNKVFRKDGYYDSVLINNVPVYIIRDDKQGNIFYFNKKFRISIGVKQ